MKNPVVVRVITWLPVGGIERRLVTVVPRLRDRGWDMRVVCLREEGALAKDLREQGIDVRLIRFSSRLSPAGLWKLRKHLRAVDASIVHSHMYRSNIPATVAGFLARTPVVLAQIHNVDSWDTPRQAGTDRSLARHRAGTICVSKAVQRDVMGTLELTEEKAPILYNGIDTAAFKPNEDLRARFRREIGAKNDQLVIVVPARLHPQKNPGGMLEIFRRSLAGYEGTKPLLVYVGQGKMEEELKSAASGIADNVLFLGRRDDMPAVYNGADVIFLSSFKEGFSNAIVEGLACGKPVLASDVGGNAEAVSSSKVGWIHPVGNKDATLAQLREVYALGIAGLQKMEGDCVARGANFSIEALVNATDALYRKKLGFGPA